MCPAHWDKLEVIWGLDKASEVPSVWLQGTTAPGPIAGLIGCPQG